MRLAVLKPGKSGANWDEQVTLYSPSQPHSQDSSDSPVCSNAVLLQLIDQERTPGTMKANHLA